MSIASELNNLENNIGDAYDAVNDMSGIIPQHKNMANLDQAIRTIPQSTGPTPGDGVLTIQQNGSTVQTFTANSSSNKTANITVPTKTSDLTNDSGFISEDDLYSEVCGSGTTITFQDAPDNAPLSDFKLKGETSQNGTPTPDAPVAVQTVTGENVVKISDGQGNEQSYEVNLGKNLFDSTNAPERYFYIKGNKLISYPDRQVSTYMRIEPNTTYTVTKPILTNNRYAIGTCSSEPAAGGTLTKSIQNNNVDNLTITSGPNDKYLIIYFKQGSDTTPNSQIFSQIQVEKGLQASSYAPYFTPIELCKLDPYQDHIYKSGSKWYVRKEIGKIPSYAGETISTDYVSTTGSLTTGATIYYALATPTDTEITNEALIEQLEAILSQGYTYAGTNNITTVIAAGNAQGELEICYTKTLPPIATETNLGLVQIGSGLSITPNGVLSADAESITVDSALSTSSPNPVQNSVITAALNNKANSADLATVATSGSYNDLSNKPTIVAGTINIGSMGTGRQEKTVNIPTQANTDYVVLLTLAGALSGGWTKISLSVASKTTSSFTMVNYNEAGYAVNNVLIDYLVIPR